MDKWQHFACTGESRLSTRPGERFGHEPLLTRAWELRHNMRSCEGVVCALAEALDATLVTLDYRLATGHGLECDIEAIALN